MKLKYAFCVDQKLYTAELRYVELVGTQKNTST